MGRQSLAAVESRARMQANRGSLRLVHRTATAIVHAATGLSASRGWRRAAMAMRGEGGQPLLQLCRVALGTFGFLFPKNDGFKLVAALAAKISKIGMITPE